MNGKEPRRRTEVVIFGGGIAGLTAAHELIERGFRVELYEKEGPSVIDDLTGAPCALGGMARTQWGRIDRPRTASLALPMRPVHRINKDVRNAIKKLRIDYGAAGLPDKKPVLEELGRLLERDPSITQLEVRGYCNDPSLRPYEEKWDQSRADYAFATDVAAALKQLLDDRHRACDLYPVPLGDPGGASEQKWTGYVTFRILEDFVPGEHGFRFFPNYYRHVFDSMRRTPIAREDGAFRETGRTVLDNILRTEWQSINHEERSLSFDFHRRPPRSLQEAFEYLKGMLHSMGANVLDFARLQRCLFKYMTSCSQRRAAECEDKSWFEYVEGHRFSPSYQRHMDTTGQMLVSMTAREADARSFGSSTVQLLIDQIYDGAKTDGTLNGPTSLAWFDHWYRYLQRQGVEFRRGTLSHFQVGEDGMLVPVVDVSGDVDDELEPANEEPRGKGKESSKRRIAIIRDYYVVAVDLPSARKIIQRSRRQANGNGSGAALRGGDFDAIVDFDVGDWRRARPTAALRHMSGLQFYFESDIPLVEGHTDYADSAWALSSISQPQFWTQRRGWWSGYRGLLSVDICDFRTPGTETTDKCAWECNLDELAREVWAQIKKTLHTDVEGEVADPIYYHVDDNLRFEAGGQGPVRENLSPYLINRVGEYRVRPGYPGQYKVQAGSVVFAGTCMQTYTRMTTMEAANESARHAVNAILRDSGFKGHRCDTWNPEEHEPPDLQYLVELDQRLYRAGLPHFLDVLGWRDVPRDVLRDPSGAAKLVTGIARPSGGPLLRKG